MVQDSSGHEEFQQTLREGVEMISVFAEVMKQLYSPYNHYSRLNAVTAKAVPQQCLFNHISPRCAPCRECKQQRSLNFITMLQSLLWCLENPNLNAQWKFNGRYAPVRSVCNCSIKLTSQKFVFKYQHEEFSVYSISNRILKQNNQITCIISYLSNILKSWSRIRHHKKLRVGK